jgi:hypothetical protein
LDDDWNYIQFDLNELIKRVHGGAFKYVSRVTIHANCRLRRVFFSDKHIGEDDLPNDFKLFIPAAATTTTAALGSTINTRV